MTVTEAITGRRSIRRFIRKEIPEDLLRQIVETSRWAPSWGNTQPWEFSIITGHALEELRAALREEIAAGASPSPEIPMPEAWPERLKKRYMEMGKIILTELGVSREDMANRQKLHEKMALLFDAPCLAVACIPMACLVEYAMLDIGLVLQTLCLSAYEKGIGSCIMALSVRYPALLRKIAAIPEDRRIVIGVALGYPDPAYPLNRFERTRADLDEFVRWVK